MTRKTLFAASICALLVFSLVGCGNTNKLQSITLTAALINGVAPTGQSGFVTLQGNGGTIQLLATGMYTNGKTKDLTGVVTYNAIVDPNYSQTDNGAALLPPCAPGDCPVPSEPPFTNGTLEFSQTGLLTAVEPAVCTWVNEAVDPSTTPAWFYVGDYVVTVTYGGVTSQPMYVPIASEAGIYDQYSNPTSSCGPSASS